MRRTVSTSSEFADVKFRNCFGIACRDRGQSRVPEPPARMIGMMSIRALRAFRAYRTVLEAPRAAKVQHIGIPLALGEPPPAQKANMRPAGKQPFQAPRCLRARARTSADVPVASSICQSPAAAKIGR